MRGGGIAYICPMCIKDGQVLMFKGLESALHIKEGVIQGDPLGMFIYATGSRLLISHLKSPNNWVQTSYMMTLCLWSYSIIEGVVLLFKQHGPMFGYLVEQSKSYKALY